MYLQGQGMSKSIEAIKTSAELSKYICLSNVRNPESGNTVVNLTKKL